jgi:transcriptional regulator with XRE-family HTH domain
MSLNEELASIRKATPFTQEDLAALAGLTRMTVQRIESGAIDPRLSSLSEMARALGMEIMLVPRELREPLQSFVRSGGRLLGQSAGAEGPLSLIDTFAASPKL